MEKRFYFLQMLIILLFVLVSCTSGNGEKPDDSGKAMKPTDEYDYILQPSVWQSQVSTSVKDIFGEEIPSEEFGLDFIKTAGFDEPKIDGLSDGERIELTASYPVVPEKKDHVKALTKLPGGSVSFPGRIPQSKMIAYVKFPGLEGLIDTVHDYFEVLIAKGESPTGKSNPITSMMGFLMMAQVDYKEDLFSWMGPEMGLVMYSATDPNKEEYLNTAFVMAIKNKDKASEKISKLVKLALGLLHQKETKEFLKRENYKTYAIETFEIPGEYMSSMSSLYGVGMSEEDIKMGILYTDEFLFISDVYGVKQLADMYTPAGSKGKEANLAAYIDLDKFMLQSSRYRESEVNKFREMFESEPERLAKLESYIKEFEDYLKTKKLGSSELMVNITEKDLQVKLSLTKSTIELFNFINKQMKDIMKLESDVYETQEPPPSEV